MFCSIEDFATTWTAESQNTIKLFQSFSDESLGKELIPDYMTIGRLALHMINNLCNTASRLALGVIDKPEAYDKGALLVSHYKNVSQDFLRLVQSNWTDHMLDEKITIFNREMIRSQALSVLFLHQMHHRAQLTVLMRLAGLDVPGMYGPSASDKRKLQQGS